MSEYAELKARLLEVQGGKLYYTNTKNSLRLEAATAIDALERELADLRAKLAQCAADNNGLVELVKATHENNEALRAKLAVAVEALTRVANYAGSSPMTRCEINVAAWSRAALAQINTQGSHK